MEPGKAPGSSCGQRLQAHPPSPLKFKRFRGSLALLPLGLLAALFNATAQQIEPRSYSNIPVGMNFLVAAYGYSEGDVTTDAASPLQDAEVQSHVAIFGYARSFGLWGMSGKFDIIEAEAWVSGQATFQGQTRS